MGKNKLEYERVVEDLRTLYTNGKLEEKTFRISKASVERRTPKKVIRRVENASYDCDDHIYGEFEYEVVVCPHCGNDLVNESEELDWNDIEYCLYCGQHLDWQHKELV